MILVVLVLTVVGVGVAYMTQVEDRLSGNDRLEKAGFYAAETGLRAGERAIQELVGSAAVSTVINTLLTTGAGPTYQPPGYNAATDYMATLLTVTFPGGGGVTTTFQNRPVFASPPAGLVDNATYTLYVRNNPEDSSGSPTVDVDRNINLISVGLVTLGGGTGITKILEEQIGMALAAQGAGGQDDIWASGQGSVNY